MAQFQFTIGANDIGTGDPGVSTIITADRGMGRNVTHRVLTAEFGDGYEQRVLNGLNSKEDSFNLSFNNRTASDINLIAKFFDIKAGKSFPFVVTDHNGNTSMTVVCEDYKITYIRETFHSLTCNLRRVYEP